MLSRVLLKRFPVLHSKFSLYITHVLLNNMSRDYIYLRANRCKNYFVLNRRYLYTNKMKEFPRLFSRLYEKSTVNISDNKNIDIEFSAKQKLGFSSKNNNIAYKDVIELIEHLKVNESQLNEKQILILLQRLCHFENETRLQLVKEIWNLAETKGLLTKVNESCNIEKLKLLLTLSAHSGDYKTFSDIIKLMNEKDVLLNKDISSLFILLYSVNQNYEEALNFIELMNKERIEFPKDVFENFTYGFLEEKDLQKVNEVLQSHILKKNQKLEILKCLIIKGHLNLAIPTIKRLCLTEFSEINTLNSFWIELLEANVPVESIIDVLKSIDSEEIYEKTLIFLLEWFLHERNVKLSIKLLEALKNKEKLMHPKYFQQLLDIERKIKGEKGLIDIMKELKNLNFILDFDTIYNHVLPYINLDNPMLAYKKIKDKTGKMSNVYEAFLVFLIHKYMFKEAFLLSQKYKRKVSNRVLNCLIKTYKETKDLCSCTLLYKSLTHLNENISWTEDELNLNVNELLYAEMMYDQCRERLKETNDTNYKMKHFKSMSGKELECHINTLDSEEDKKTAYKYLLLYFCQQGDAKKVLELEERINQTDFIWSNGLRARLFHLYTKSGLVEESLNQLKKIEENKNDNFVIDDFKILDFATLLIQKNEIEKCKEILQNYKFRPRAKLSSNCQTFLNTLAKSKYASDIIEVTDILLRNGYCKKHTAVFSPTIKAKLLHNDVKSAVHIFITLAKADALIPLEQELLATVIRINDVENVEKVYNAIKLVAGEDLANAHLAVALAQCEKRKELEMLIKTKFIIYDNINHCLTRVPKEIQAQTLMTIIEAFQVFPNKNVDVLYNNLISILDLTEQSEKLVKLLTKLQSNSAHKNKYLEDRILRILKFNKLNNKEPVNTRTNKEKS